MDPLTAYYILQVVLVLVVAVILAGLFK